MSEEIGNTASKQSRIDDFAKLYNTDLERRFTYHAPKDNQSMKYAVLRGEAKEFAYLIKVLTPDSREQSLALTNLEQAVFWANAAIARNE